MAMLCMLCLLYSVLDMGVLGKGSFSWSQWLHDIHNHTTVMKLIMPTYSNTAEQNVFTSSAVIAFKQCCIHVTLEDAYVQFPENASMYINTKRSTTGTTSIPTKPSCNDITLEGSYNCTRLCYMNVTQKDSYIQFVMNMTLSVRIANVKSLHDVTSTQPRCLTVTQAVTYVKMSEIIILHVTACSPTTETTNTFTMSTCINVTLLSSYVQLSVNSSWYVNNRCPTSITFKQPHCITVMLEDTYILFFENGSLLISTKRSTTASAVIYKKPSCNYLTLSVGDIQLIVNNFQCISNGCTITRREATSTKLCCINVTLEGSYTHLFLSGAPNVNAKQSKRASDFISTEPYCLNVILEQSYFQMSEKSILHVTLCSPTMVRTATSKYLCFVNVILEGSYLKLVVNCFQCDSTEYPSTGSAPASTKPCCINVTIVHAQIQMNVNSSQCANNAYPATKSAFTITKLCCINMTPEYTQIQLKVNNTQCDSNGCPTISSAATSKNPSCVNVTIECSYVQFAETTFLHITARHSTNTIISPKLHNINMTVVGSHIQFKKRSEWIGAANPSTTSAGTSTTPNCTNVTLEGSYVQFSENGSLSVNIGYLTPVIHDYLLMPDNKTVCVCFPLSPQLLHCNTTTFDRLTYRIEHHSLINGSQSLAELGDYYVDDAGSATACSTPIKVDRTTPRCHYLKLNRGQYQNLPNGSISILPASITLDNPQYVINRQQINLCYPLTIDFLNCKHVSLTPFFTTLRPDFTVHTATTINTLGDYYYDDPSDSIIFCHQVAPILAIYNKLYIVSTTCIFLAFLYQFLMTKHTIHRRCLLCHHCSWVVTNIWFIYWNYNYSRPFSDLENYATFIVGYFAGASTCCWLIIASLDVWRSFANIHHFSGRWHSRSFVRYSLLGWGMPLLALGMVLTLNLSLPKRHPIVGISRGWFHNRMPSYICYYGPVNIAYCTSAILFLLTVHHIRKAVRHTKEVLQRHRHRQVLLASVRLFGAMGVFWIIKTPLWLFKDSTSFPAVLVSDGLISVQGMILLPIIVCNQQTVDVIKQQLRRASSTWKSTSDKTVSTIELRCDTNETRSGSSSSS